MAEELSRASEYNLTALLSKITAVQRNKMAKNLQGHIETIRQKIYHMADPNLKASFSKSFSDAGLSGMTVKEKPASIIGALVAIRSQTLQEGRREVEELKEANRDFLRHNNFISEGQNVYIILNGTKYSTDSSLQYDNENLHKISRNVEDLESKTNVQYKGSFDKDIEEYKEIDDPPKKITNSNDPRYYRENIKKEKKPDSPKSPVVSERQRKEQTENRRDKADKSEQEIKSKRIKKEKENEDAEKEKRHSHWRKAFEAEKLKEAEAEKKKEQDTYGITRDSLFKRYNEPSVLSNSANVQLAEKLLIKSMNDDKFSAEEHAEFADKLKNLQKASGNSEILKNKPMTKYEIEAPSESIKKYDRWRAKTQPLTREIKLFNPNDVFEKWLKKRNS